MGIQKLTLTKIKDSGESLKKWHLICHLQKDAKVGGEFFYRIFEYSAEDRKVAERRALQILHDLSKRLSTSRFTLIVVVEGGYPGASHESLEHPNVSVALPKFSDPKEILAEWNAENVFKRASVYCPTSQKVM